MLWERDKTGLSQELRPSGPPRRKLDASCRCFREAKDRSLPHLPVSTTPTHQGQRCNSKTGFWIRLGMGQWIITHPSQEPVFKFLLIGMLFPLPKVLEGDRRWRDV